jgi:hypothetical protein
MPRPYLEALLGVEHLTEPASNNRVVIDDDYPIRAHRPSTAGPCGRGRGVGVSHSRQPRAARSRDSRYGARYLATIFVGGDQLGVSLISEVDPCPPVMCALR